MATDKFTILLAELRNLDADLEAPSLKYKVADLLNMVYETVSAMHKSQLDDKDEIRKLKDVINAGANGGGGGDKYKKGILEYKVVQDIKSLTGDKSQFRQWHQKLINALSTIHGNHSEIIKDIEKAMDVGEKVDDVIHGLETKYDLTDFDKDIHCIMMDKCEGEAYDKIKGLQHKQGAEVYITIYRWFTEISGLGLAAQAYKAMNPDQAKKESEIEHTVDKWIERNRKLESHGK